MNQSYWDMIGKFQYFNQIEICKSILMQNQESQFTFKLKQKALSFQRISNIQTNWFVIWTKFHNSNTISLFLSSRRREARGGHGRPASGSISKRPSVYKLWEGWKNMDNIFGNNFIEWQNGPDSFMFHAIFIPRLPWPCQALPCRPLNSLCKFLVRYWPLCNIRLLLPINRL